MTSWIYERKHCTQRLPFLKSGTTNETDAFKLYFGDTTEGGSKALLPAVLAQALASGREFHAADGFDMVNVMRTLGGGIDGKGIERVVVLGHYPQESGDARLDMSNTAMYVPYTQVVVTHDEDIRYGNGNVRRVFGLLDQVGTVTSDNGFTTWLMVRDKKNPVVERIKRLHLAVQRVVKDKDTSDSETVKKYTPDSETMKARVRIVMMNANAVEPEEVELEDAKASYTSIHNVLMDKKDSTKNHKVTTLTAPKDKRVSFLESTSSATKIVQVDMVTTTVTYVLPDGTVLMATYDMNTNTWTINNRSFSADDDATVEFSTQDYWVYFQFGSHCVTVVPRRVVAGSGADPYIFPVRGPAIKLPNMHASYRMYQNQHSGVFVDIVVDDMRISLPSRALQSTPVGTRPVMHGFYITSLRVSTGTVLDTRSLACLARTDVPWVSTPVRGHDALGGIIHGMYTSRHLRIDGMASVEVRIYDNPQICNAFVWTLPRRRPGKVDGLAYRNYRPSMYRTDGKKNRGKMFITGNQRKKRHDITNHGEIRESVTHPLLYNAMFRG